MSVAGELFESVEIHRGGRTIVRRARWRRDTAEAAVIVKSLDPEAVDARSAARWEHEFQVLRHLDGVGTPVAHAFMYDRGVPQLVIEDVQGVALRSLMDAGALTHARTLRIAIQLADALMRIHERRVIHKDINPSNVVVFGADDRVQVIDFGIASMLSVELPSIAATASIEGTLPYVSPEQTGRMNRSLDHRSDLYSLGVTLYEALVGATPFASTDALELIHAHLAKIPRAPHEVDPRVPALLSSIVMKLLAKTAEERYQTAFGLKKDLETCLDRLGRSEEPAFELGTHDERSRFLLPQKLYGRAGDVDLLLQAFERVSAGAVETLCISGAAGIGKTAVVHEVHKPIVQKRGHFLSGKFDQYKRDIPYQSLIQAFQGLVRQVLAEDASSIQHYRDAILRAVGAHGRILSNVIPELELVLGPQPEVQALEPAQSQERFHAVFLQFVRAYATPTSPLVLFLDDLQWADLPSLELIKVLTTTAGTAHLLVILAYRDNEVLEGHPARILFNDIGECGATVHSVHLEGLTLEDTVAFLADTVRQPADKVRDLAALCMKKTAGNAFFLGQFVLSLHRAAHIAFDAEQGRFRWDMAQLERTPMTDNVVELMSGKLRDLPRDTQEVVRLAACLGNKFDLKLLASVAGYDVQTTARALWPALVERFVLPQDETYKFAASHGTELAPSYRFLHDRVQQAAYALISEAETAALHHRVGTTLLRTANEHERDERIFDIVNHLAAGRELIVDSGERLELVQLAVAAFRKAKSATAFAPALVYVKLALELLGESGWESEYELTFQAYLERAICEYVLGNATESDRLFEITLMRARTPLQRARVRSEMELLFLSLGKHQSVIDSVLRALAELGFAVPNASKPDEVLAAMAQLRDRGRALLGDRKIEELLNLAEAVDPVAIQAHEHLDHLAPSAFFLNMNLYQWLGAQNFELAVRTGNTPRTPFNFSVCGLSNLVQGDLDTAYLLGKLGVALSDRYDSYHHKAACYFHFCLINSWKHHYRIDEQHGKVAYGFALAAWNHFFISWSAHAHVRALTLMGAPLEKVAGQAREYVGLVAKTNRENAAFLTAAERMASCLRGTTKSATSYDDDAFDEARFVRETSAYENPAPAFDYYIYKLQALFVLGRAREAQSLFAQAERFVSPQWVEVTEYYFYRALVAAAVHDVASDDEKPALLAEVAAQRDKLAGVAAVNPENFANRHLLVSAEHARLEARHWDAVQLYEAAIRTAAEGEFVQNEAIAHELAAKFWRTQGKPEFATSHLKQALVRYRRWGADRKVEDLLEHHPELEEVVLEAARAQTRTIGGEVPLFARIRSFDIASVVKASQAISTEIVLDKLLARLMNVVTENAGATRGLLLLREHDAWTVATEWTAESGAPETTAATPLANYPRVAHSVVRYVERTLAALNVADVGKDPRFTSDAYVATGAQRSVLCLPVMHKGGAIALLYLENDLTTGAFAANHVDLLSVLSSQIAISIENAQLYAQLEARVQERTAQLVDANSQLKAARDALWGEMDLAKRIQTVLLPDGPKLDGYEVAAQMRPADQVGGDYYDVISVGGRDWFAIGDVSGHGVTAGLVMMMAQTAIRAVLQSQPDVKPSVLLETVNRVITRNISALGESYQKYMTLTVFCTTGQGRFTYSGLHQDFFVYRAATRSAERVKTRGMWIGLSETLEDLHDDDLVLDEGDVLLLYTDGITEARKTRQSPVNDNAIELYGSERLVRVFEDQGGALLPHIKSTILRSLEGFQCDDDVSLLLAKRTLSVAAE